MLQEQFSKTFEKLLALSKHNAPNKICICLSGGSDSLALLLLTQNWASNNNSQVYAVTIDHKLRIESTSEAQEIHEFCANLGIEHHILNWEHDGIKSNVQEEARNARYELITNWCKENKVGLALTGHIFEDQIEQVLLSLIHGSGIYSFLMPESRNIEEILFLRPLLDFTKDQLQEYLIAKKITWWNDSSNESHKYTRNKVRPLAKHLLEIGDSKRIRTSISNLKRAGDFLNQLSDDFLHNKFEVKKIGYGKVNLAEYLNLDDEIRFSSLRKMLEAVRNKKSEIRLDALMNLDEDIKNLIPKQLFGCSLHIHKDNIYFIRDFGKEKIDPLIEDGIWDNRFEFAQAPGQKMDKLPIDYITKILTTNPEILNFEDDLPKKLKKRVILHLPGIFKLEKLLAIPHIYNYNEPEFTQTKFTK